MSPTKVLLVHPQHELMTREVAEAVRSVDGVILDMADDPVAALAKASDSEVLISFFASDQLLAGAPKLRWIQALGSGVDGFIHHSSLRPDILLTSGAGIHAQPVSEAILAMMLALARDLPQAFRDQQACRWGREMPRLLGTSEVLIIGVGAIGAAVGAKCAAFGARVIGLSERTDRPAGFSCIYSKAVLYERLAEADFVVLTAPLSPATAGIINAAALERMKSSAYIVNAGRGGLIDDADLVAALETGRIAGAALDVFKTEPLPEDSPYWALPNVLVTPHRAGYFLGYGEAIAKIAVTNLHHYRSGRFEKLVNRVRDHQML